mgnify:CR=1 FL=1
MTLQLVQIIFLLVCLALCALILLQQSKSGGGMGALGGGASSTVFGARGAGTFLYKTTRFLAAVFFVGALLLGYLQNREAHRDNSILNQQTAAKDVEKSEAALDIPTSGMDNPPPASNTDVPTPAE